MARPQCAGDPWFALWDWLAGSEARASYGCTQNRPPLDVYNEQGDPDIEEQDRGFVPLNDALAMRNEEGALLQEQEYGQKEAQEEEPKEERDLEQQQEEVVEEKENEKDPEEEQQQQQQQTRKERTGSKEREHEQR